MTLKRTSAFLKTHVRHGSKRTAGSPTSLDRLDVQSQSPESTSQQSPSSLLTQQNKRNDAQAHKAATHNTLTEPLAPQAVGSPLRSKGEDGKVRGGSARGLGASVKGKEREKDVDETDDIEEKKDARVLRQSEKEEKRKLLKLYEYQRMRKQADEQRGNNSGSKPYNKPHRALRRLKKKARGVIPFWAAEPSLDGYSADETFSTTESPSFSSSIQDEVNTLDSEVAALYEAAAGLIDSSDTREACDLSPVQTSDESMGLEPRQKTQRAIEKEWNKLNNAQKMERVITQTYTEVFTSVAVVFETRRTYWTVMNDAQRRFIQALEKECWLLEERADEIRRRGRTDNAEVKEIQAEVWAIKCDVLIHYAPLWRWDVASDSVFMSADGLTEADVALVNKRNMQRQLRRRQMFNNYTSADLCDSEDFEDNDIMSVPYADDETSSDDEEEEAINERYGNAQSSRANGQQRTRLCGESSDDQADCSSSTYYFEL